MHIFAYAFGPKLSDQHPYELQLTKSTQRLICWYSDYWPTHYVSQTPTRKSYSAFFNR